MINVSTIQNKKYVVRIELSHYFVYVSHGSLSSSKWINAFRLSEKFTEGKRERWISHSFSSIRLLADIFRRIYFSLSSCIKIMQHRYVWATKWRILVIDQHVYIKFTKYFLSKCVILEWQLGNVFSEGPDVGLFFQQEWSMYRQFKTRSM